MAIEEKDNRQNIKITTSRASLLLDGTFSWDSELGDAMDKALNDCLAENKAQEILIVIDKGF